MEQKKEEHGQAIAESIFEMAKLKVPTISIVIGEGSSGGALAIGVTNKIFMLENAVYSILSPEGFASILYKDSSKASEAAENMKMTAQDLKEFGVIDKIISEPKNGAQEELSAVTNDLKMYIVKAINELRKFSKEELIEKRYEKFRKMGN